MQEFCQIAKCKLSVIFSNPEIVNGILNSIDEKSVVSLHILLTLGANLNITDKNGNTLLHVSALKG